MTSSTKPELHDVCIRTLSKKDRAEVTVRRKNNFKKIKFKIELMKSESMVSFLRYVSERTNTLIAILL